MKLRLPRRRIARAAIYLVSFFLIVIAIDLVLVEVRRTIHPGYDTTRILSPTMPDGSIDYLSAIENYFSRGVTPQNNAAIPILQALGRAALAQNQPTDGITDRLGMPHLPETGDYFISKEDYLKQHPSTEEFDIPEDFSWPLTIGPNTRAWVAANEKPLAKLIEATRRPRYFIPFNGGNRPTVLVAILLPQVHILRYIDNALLTHALIRLQAGDFAGFQQDIGASHRLGRLLQQDPTIVCRLVGMGIESGTCHVERFAVGSGKFTDQQIRQLLSDLNSVGEPSISTDCIDAGERYLTLDLTQSMAHSNAAAEAAIYNGVLGRGEPEIVFHFLPIQYDESMRQLNSCYDASIIAMQQPTYAMRIQAEKLFDQGMADTAAKNSIELFISGNWIAPRLMPSVVGYGTKIDISRTQFRLTQIALAMALFKFDHGAYPGTLSELSPQILPDVPDDVFTDQPMQYSRTGNAYALYSIGPNMTDDGGKQTKPGDDIDANEIFRTFSAHGAPISPTTQN
jgi:hypothetical protein